MFGWGRQMMVQVEEEPLLDLGGKRVVTRKWLRDAMMAAHASIWVI